MDPPIRRRGNGAIQPDGKRNLQLVNRAVYRDLVSVPSERDVLERRAGDVARIEIVADVPDIGVDNARLYLKDKRLRIIERGVDALLRPSQLSVEPSNVDAEIRPFSQHEVVGVYPGRVRSTGCGDGLAGGGGRCLRRRPVVSCSGIPGKAGHKYQNHDGTAGQ